MYLQAKVSKNGQLYCVVIQCINYQKIQESIPLLSRVLGIINLETPIFWIFSLNVCTMYVEPFTLSIAIWRMQISYIEFIDRLHLYLHIKTTEGFLPHYILWPRKTLCWIYHKVSYETICPWQMWKKHKNRGKLSSVLQNKTYI